MKRNNILTVGLGLIIALQSTPIKAKVLETEINNSINIDNINSISYSASKGIEPKLFDKAIDSIAANSTKNEIDIMSGGIFTSTGIAKAKLPENGGVIINLDGTTGAIVNPEDRIESYGLVVENLDGSITFPTGGEVIKLDGTRERILPYSMLIPNKSESVLVPVPKNGGVITNPYGGIIIVKPEDKIESYGQVIENLDGSITFPTGGEVTNLYGMTEIILSYSTLTPNKSESVPVPTPEKGGIIINLDGTEGPVVNPEDKIESYGLVVENLDGSITFPTGGEVIKPDGTRETILPYSMLTLSKQVSIIIPTPGTGGVITNLDDTTIAVNQGDIIESNGSVTENLDATITFINGGTLTRTNGKIEIIKAGGVLKPNEIVEVSTPETGGTIINSDGTEGPVVNPEDKIESYGLAVENLDGSITFPSGGIVIKPDTNVETIMPGGVLIPNEIVEIPTPETGGMILNPDDTTIIVAIEDKIISNGSVIENPGSTVFLGGGKVIKTDGTTEIIIPGGVLVPNRPLEIPTLVNGGIIINLDETKGPIVNPKDKVVSNGPIIENLDGTIVFPGGGTITKPSGTIEIIIPGATLIPNKSEYQ